MSPNVSLIDSSVLMLQPTTGQPSPIPLNLPWMHRVNLQSLPLLPATLILSASTSKVNQILV